jgi:hypothetical protein
MCEPQRAFNSNVGPLILDDLTFHCLAMHLTHHRLSSALRRSSTGGWRLCTRAIIYRCLRSPTPSSSTRCVDAMRAPGWRPYGVNAWRLRLIFVTCSHFLDVAPLAQTALEKTAFDTVFLASYLPLFERSLSVSLTDFGCILVPKLLAKLLPRLLNRGAASLLNLVCAYEGCRVYCITTT